MPSFLPEQLTDQWARLRQDCPEPVRRWVRALAERHQDDLASYFYQEMLRDPVTSQFISHDQVKTRLHAQMRRWIVSVFSAEDTEELQRVIAQQKQVGKVHARIDLPVHLVLCGARNLKKRFYDLIGADAQFSANEAVFGLRLVSNIMDLSMEIMSQAYENSHDRNSRAEEAYRLFSVVQNVTAERERQRAALLEWENQLMFALAVGVGSVELPRLGASELGLWFRHKGAHAFEGTTEASLILQAIDYVDEVLLPIFGTPKEDEASLHVQRLRDLREQTKNIGFYLETLFQQSSELESGRDVLTHLLNRKFLPVVLTKEVAYARQKGRSFALLAVDVDHFKLINDTYGHEAGDMVLQQIALLLSNSSRGGDTIFRLGGEEFLLLLVDIDRERALRAAEQLCRQVEAEAFRLPMERTVAVTISIGLSVHDGHPDYQRTLQAADEALYQAKRDGRNRVVAA